MATLRAHGKEIWRGDRMWVDDDGKTNRRMIAIFEDRWLLQCSSYQSLAMSCGVEKPRWTSFGWKRYKRILEGHVEAAIEILKSKGYRTITR